MPKRAQYEHYTITVGTFATHCKTVMFEVQPLTVATNTILEGSAIAFHGPFPSATVPSSECDA